MRTKLRQLSIYNLKTASLKLTIQCNCINVINIERVCPSLKDMYQWV